MRSALYEGWVRHRRLAPVGHAFHRKLFLAYLDLDELERVFRTSRLWSAHRPAPLRFDRRDHLGDPATPLDKAVRERVASSTGRWPEGPIALLTQLRQFGYLFNPVSFYFCFAPDGEQLEALVADVTNTPWKERFAYVLDARGAERRGGSLRLECPKAFHVSPFLPLDLEYRWRVGLPGRRLALHVEALRAGERLFDATLALQRRPLGSRTLASLLLRHAFQTLRVTAGIHLEALRLWRKGAPFHPHPGSTR